MFFNLQSFVNIIDTVVISKLLFKKKMCKESLRKEERSEAMKNICNIVKEGNGRGGKKRKNRGREEERRQEKKR